MVSATVTVTCLGSGSSGNSILIQAAGRALLVDAGFSASKIGAALRERGVQPGDVEAVLISHEHADHILGVDVFCRRYHAPLLSSPLTLAAMRPKGGRASTVAVRVGESRTLGPFDVSSFPVTHDAIDPAGFLIAAEGVRVAVATDLGCVTPEVVEAASAADLVVVEANHDVDQLRLGPYPAHLKRRIMSPSGHLSNEQTGDLMCESLGTRRQTYWLAHLSRTNNTRTKALDGVTGYLAAQGLRASVEVTERDGPSLVWQASAPGS
jgi:phosphoribosyl 1,2-cyclic phosphodiesterase